MLLAVPAVVEGWQQRDAKAIGARGRAGGRHCSRTSSGPRTARTTSGIRCAPSRIRRGAGTGSIPVRAVAHNVHELFVGDHVSAGVHTVSAIVFVALLVVIARRWPLSFTLYAGVALVVALSSRNLDSLERYGLATLPFVLAGADVIAEPGRERVVLCLAGAGLVAASMLAFTGVLVP